MYSSCPPLEDFKDAWVEYEGEWYFITKVKSRLVIEGGQDG